MDHLSEQVSSFILVFLTGVVWGIFFDFYRSRRLLHRAGRRRNDPWDFLFWLCSAALVGLGLIVSNWLELRLFVWIALVIGYFIYARLGRAVCRPVIEGLNRLIELLIFPFTNFHNRWRIRKRVRKKA